MPVGTPQDRALTKQLCQSLQSRGKRLQTFARIQKLAQQSCEKEVNKQQYMENIIRLRFLQERTAVDTGASWKSNDGSNPILRATGQLMQAAIKAVRNTYKMLTNIKWNLGKVRRMSEGKKKVNIAPIHQNGEGNMPARPFFNNPTKAELAPANAFAVKYVKAFVAQGLGIKGVRR
jgi:hypothetical protein